MLQQSLTRQTVNTEDLHSYTEISIWTVGLDFSQRCSCSGRRLVLTLNPAFIQVTSCYQGTSTKCKVTQQTRTSRGCFCHVISTCAQAVGWYVASSLAACPLVLFKAVGSMTINCFIVLLFRYIPIYIENQSCRYVFLACYTQFGDKLNAEYIQRGMSQLLEAPTLVYFSCSVCT